MPGQAPRRQDERQLTDLAALADGSLAPERRAEVEACVADSRRLAELLARQRRAVAAIRRARRTSAPTSLHARVQAELERARSRPPLRPALVLPAAAVAAALIVALVLSGGSAPAPSVEELATLGDRSATEPAPTVPPDHRAWLSRRAAGLPFPNLAEQFGWRAAGAREDTVDGRAATTVFYKRGGRQIAYTIVLGEPLAHSGRFATLVDGRRHIVTWLRRGHTCVLSSDQASRAELRRLAAWPGNGRLPS